MARNEVDGPASEPVDNRMRAWLRGLSLWLVAWWTIGCGGSIPTDAVDRPPPTQTGPPVVATMARAGDREPDEVWDVHYLGDSKVGYARTRFETIEEDGRPLVRISASSRTTLQRFGQSVTQDLEVISVETVGGGLVRFRSELKAGPESTVTEGTVAAGELTLKTTTKGKTDLVRRPWKDQWKGPFATERSLRERPLKAGEARTLEGLLPVFNEIGTIRLVARTIEATRLLDGSQSLRRVESQVDVAGAQIRSVLWVDEQGETLKSAIPAMKHVAYRTTREIAEAAGSQGTFDLGDASVVQLKPPPDADLHAVAKAVYRARLSPTADAGGLDRADVFRTALSQEVVADGDDVWRVTVRAVRPDQPASIPRQDAPTDEYLRPNNFIQSDDPRVMQMAAAVAPGQDDPWQLACALERHVKQSIRAKNFSQAFATAAEVAESLEGDCTEHAVLLAALCRARKLPARVAIGLVYYPAAMGFAYHMWTEAWIEDRWIPLDATLGRGGIGGGHLLLAQSSLDGASAYSAFLPVFSVLGRLELQLVAVEPAAR